VLALDGAKCQKAKHGCSGVYHCSELDHSLLAARFEPNEDDGQRLLEAQEGVCEQDQDSMEGRAIA
jgi:hypothetical protein